MSEQKFITYKDVNGLIAKPHVHKGYFWIYKGNKRIGSYSQNSCTVDLKIKNEWVYATCKNIHQAMRWIYLKTQQPK